MNVRVPRWLVAMFGLDQMSPDGQQIRTATKRQMLTPRLTFGISDQGEAEEARRGLQALNGRIMLPKFNPADPQSVQAAIRQMELDIDAKIGPYSKNKIVSEAARKLKSDFREVILKQLKSAARSVPQKN